MLRLVNAVVQVIKHLQPLHEHTVDLQRGDGDVGFGREAPLRCDVVVLLRLIDWTCETRLEHSTGGQIEDQQDPADHLLQVRGDRPLDADGGKIPVKFSE